MFDWAKKREPHMSGKGTIGDTGLRTPMSPEMIGVLAEHHRVLIASAGCLLSNLIGLGENMAAKLALGQVTDAEARSVAKRLKEIGLTIESMCDNDVSRLRANLLPEIPVTHPHEHP